MLTLKKLVEGKDEDFDNVISDVFSDDESNLTFLSKSFSSSIAKLTEKYQATVNY